jgi:acyl transferase domain-containing protein
VANLFDLHGPNYVVDAACGSTLAALAVSIEGLVRHKFDAVVTGGVDRNMGPWMFVKLSRMGALSATGSRPFDKGADGFVMGEGAALFVLRRLEDAERAGDRIYAVVRGIGAASDGRGKAIAAPNPVGQRLAVERAWRDAGLSPATCSMVEAHGTSTPVGDVVEVNTLTEAFASAGLPAGSVALGSVKSNIGHLRPAAGAAGLLKVTLALHEKLIPPSLGFEHPNPGIDWTSSPFRVNTEARPRDVVNGGVRCAAVSAFGFGGTNFHAVLEEYVPGRIPGNDGADVVRGGRGLLLPGRARVPRVQRVDIVGEPVEDELPADLLRRGQSRADFAGAGQDGEPLDALRHGEPGVRAADGLGDDGSQGGVVAQVGDGGVRRLA